MNNLKKIGLSALAGSLVAISANAAELTVSGAVEVTYTDTGGNSGNEVTGNSFGANSNMVFTGSGDVGFGTVTMNRALSDAGAITTSYQTLDMGDMGTFSFDSTAGGLVGITANDDILPTAYEEIFNGTTGSAGITGVGSTNVIGYTNTFAGVSLSVGYANGVGASQTAESGSSGPLAHGSTRDVYLSMSPIDGLTVGVGQSVNSSTDTGINSTDTVESVANINYTMGPVAVGYRMAESEDGTAATASHSITAWSIAFNVNENLAISYSDGEIDHFGVGANADVEEDFSSINVSYTQGGMTVAAQRAEADNAAGTLNSDEEVTEIVLSLAF